MSTDLGGTPDLAAVREMRADVAGPTAQQRETARARLRAAQAEQPARSRLAGPARRPPPGRVALLAVAAVALLVAALAVIPVVLRGQDAPPASTTTSATTSGTTSATAEANPTPYATGSVWEAQSAGDRERMDRLRRDNVERLPGGGVRILMPDAGDAESFSRALNADGIPVRVWEVLGARGSWSVGPPVTIDTEDGIDMSRTPTGAPVIAKSEIVADYEDGPGTRLVALTLPSIPSTPLDVSYSR